MLAYQIVGQVDGEGGLLAEGIAPERVADGVREVARTLGLKCNIWPADENAAVICLTTPLGGRLNDLIGLGR